MNNKLASEIVAVLGVVAPGSIAAGTVTSAWISARDFDRYMAVVIAGTLGASATLAAKIQIASDASGTGAEDCTGKSITTLTKAASQDDKQAVINIEPEDLVGSALSFKAGTATHFRLSMTVAVATSAAAGVVLGVNGRIAPASNADAASVVQIV
jgi:hypothetical protein